MKRVEGLFAGEAAWGGPGCLSSAAPLVPWPVFPSGENRPDFAADCRAKDAVPGWPHQGEKHGKNALCGFSAGLTMKCEPSHRMVWYSTNHENRHFPTIPEAPQYPPRPHQPQNRIKSRGVVQPAANCRPPPPSPPQHGPKSPQSAIRRRISFRRPKPGDCEFI